MGYKKSEMIYITGGGIAGKVSLFFQKMNPSVYEKNILPFVSLTQDLAIKPFVKKEIKRMVKEETYPLFKVIEIETINRCNNDCAFCPVNKNVDSRSFKLMDRGVFISIINQLRDLNYSGKLNIYSNNEPLLDKRIIEFAEIARLNLPNANIALFTNGILLTVEKFQKLIPNLDFLLIDNYHDNNALNDPVQNIYNFIEEKEEYYKKVKIRLIHKNAIRTTRGGQAPNRSKVSNLTSPCICPFNTFIVRPDGKISLCNRDALGTYTLGDLTKQSIVEIWGGKEFWTVRHEMLQGRNMLNLCSDCDAFAYAPHNILSLFHVLRDK